MVRLFFISVGPFGQFGQGAQFGQFAQGAQFGQFAQGAQFAQGGPDCRLWRLFWA